MSLQFSDTSTYKGIIQIIEKECGFNRGDISGNSDRLKEFTADVNMTIDDYIELAIKSSGRWQFDDSGHTDYPIITTNLVSTQRDYSFTTDEDGNLILDIYRVAILPSATATVYEEITPVDAQTDKNSDFVANNTSITGIPSEYDKTANGIFLNPIPNYNATNGLKVYINREGSYFTTSDTTKKPGVPGIHHEYFALKSSLRYARRKSLSNLNALEKAVIDFEGSERLGVAGKIAEYFSKREKDDITRLTGEPIIYE